MCEGINLANNVFYPLLKYGYYPHQVSEDFIISTFLKENNYVIDVGANIGYVSLLCSQYIGHGVVYSFEPSAITYNYVKQLASQIDQIKPQPLAVSNTAGMVRFIDEPMSDRSHIAEKQGHSGYLVECCTIDDWACKNHVERVDFIKVDAEGHDIQVIEGAINIIKSNRPIIEFEACTLDEVSQVFNIFQNQDLTAGYRIYRCCNKYPLSTQTESELTNNWFAIPRERRSSIPDFIFLRGFLKNQIVSVN